MKVLIIAALVGVALCGPVPRDSWQKPAFCNENDCPRYRVMLTGDGYEVRTYEPATWVSTSYTAMNYSQGSGQSFWKLFNYIQGENEGNNKIKMTAPVTTQVIPGTGPNCESQFTRSFYIPYIYQNNAPKPTNPDVYLTQQPETTVFVRSHSGYTSEEQTLSELVALSQAINNSSMYKQGVFYTSGYDSPYKWWDRHNEVWLEARK